MIDKPEKITNPYYKAFLDGYLLQEINRADIIKVLDNIQDIQPNWNPHILQQARCLVIIAWATGARPNEYLRLKTTDINKTKEFLEIRIQASKGGKGKTLSLPCLLNNEPDPLITEINDYVRLQWQGTFLFWFFQGTAKHNKGITKKTTHKDGQITEKHYDKIYDDLGTKLRYYFPRWFNIIMEEGIPPYYLRHNRGTIVTDNAGITAAAHTLGHKSEATTSRFYSHLTKKKIREIGPELMK